MKVDTLSIIYAVVLVAVLVKLADWLAPYENLSESGCAVAYVYDGDTVSLICGGDETTARLLGFDTPETKGAGCDAEEALGQAATQRLRALVAAGPVTLSGTVRDKYGRLLATMRIDGVDVADTLIAEDLAVPYTGGTRINWCDRLGAS